MYNLILSACVAADVVGPFSDYHVLTGQLPSLPASQPRPHGCHSTDLHTIVTGLEAVSSIKITTRHSLWLINKHMYNIIKSIYIN